MKIILTDDITAQRKADAKKYAGLHEFCNLFCKEMRGEVGHILLHDEVRLESYVMGWVKQVEQRIEEERAETDGTI